MKAIKRTVLFLMFITCFWMFTFHVNADGEETESVEEFVIENGVLVKYNDSGTTTEVVIPEGVVEIGERAFYRKTALRTVVLPNGVKKINDEAFYNCYNLSNVNIPDEVEYIGEYAFYRCPIGELSLPEGLLFIGKSAFYNCRITELKLPDSVTTIGECAFAGAKIKSVNIPRNFEVAQLSVLGLRGIFYECTDLREIIFPEGITFFENFITGTPGIQKLVIPASVTKLEGAAFACCSDLEEIEFLGPVKEIPSEAFNNCTKLKKITFVSQDSIGRGAFRLCSSLTDIEFVDHVNSVGENAFENCSSLKEIVLLSPLAKIPDYAFSGCESLTDVYIPDSVTEISANAFPVSDGLTLHGGSGSFTEKYAAENGYKFIADDNTASVNITAKYSGNHVKLSWDAVEGAEGYAVARIDSGNQFVYITGDVTSSEYEFDDPAFDKKNKYIVRVYKDGKLKNYLPTDAVTPVLLNPKDLNSLDSSIFSWNYLSWKDGPREVSYTGSQIKPILTMYDGEYRLVSGKDYTVAYANNINVGTATITLTGCNDYKGNISYTFEIKRRSVYRATLSEIPSQTYTGKAIRPSVTVTVDNRVLTYGVDYTLSYSKNINVGTANVTVLGSGNYSSSTSTTFSIIKATPAAPDKLVGTNPSKKGASDGKISGVSAEMEYSTVADFSRNVNNCTSDTIGGLKAGTYYVRVKESKNTYVGPAGSITLTDPVFDDVKESDWYYNAVKFVYERNIMSGSDNLFKPKALITRAEFTRVLYNHAGADASSITIKNPFPDVEDNKWYTNAILWAKQNNIASGNGDGTFGVKNNIQRQQVAVMLYKYAQMQGYDTSFNPNAIDEFSDSSTVKGWAKEAMNWAVTQGVMSGKKNTDGTYSLAPAGYATRAECASMIKKLLERNETNE